MFNSNHSCTVYEELWIVNWVHLLHTVHRPQAMQRFIQPTFDVNVDWAKLTLMTTSNADVSNKICSLCIDCSGLLSIHASQIFHVITALGQSAYQMTTSDFDLCRMAITKLTLFFVVSYWVLLNFTWNEEHNTAYTLTWASCCCVMGQGCKDTKIWTVTSSSAFFKYEYIYNLSM